MMAFYKSHSTLSSDAAQLVYFVTRHIMQLGNATFSASWQAVGETESISPSHAT
jgi:hypothetical protein